MERKKIETLWSQNMAQRGKQNIFHRKVRQGRKGIKTIQRRDR